MARSVRQRMLKARLERCKTVADSYRQGSSLSVIGKELGVTKERVRQLLVLYEHQTGEKVPRRTAKNTMWKRKENDDSF